MLIVLVLIAFGTAWLLSALQEEPLPLYAATIDRDCAPWDGMAVTVSIPWWDTATVNISIYQSPPIMHPVTLSLPDETMESGNAYLLPPAQLPEPLTGKVFFERVEAEKLVEGRFDLVSEAGQKFRGRFQAEWGNQVVYCG